jgi:hypothetical protein
MMSHLLFGGMVICLLAVIYFVATADFQWPRR